MRQYTMSSLASTRSREMTRSGDTPTACSLTSSPTGGHSRSTPASLPNRQVAQPWPRSRRQSSSRLKSGSWMRRDGDGSEQTEPTRPFVSSTTSLHSYLRTSRSAFAQRDDETADDSGKGGPRDVLGLDAMP